jgi:hypothetical protein
MQTGVLTALQLTSMFPNLVVENFYKKTQNSIEAGKNDPPHGYVIPVQRDMTRVADARQHPARAAHRGRRGHPRVQDRRRDLSRRFLRGEA